MSDLRKRTVLIVDDSRADREACDALLTGDGFAVIQAPNGLEGFKLARSQRPDLVVMGIVMPIMDGLAATRTLRSDPMTADIPIILLSRRMEEEDVAAGIEAGADDYLFKPIRPKEFIVRVRARLHRHHESQLMRRAHAGLVRRTRAMVSLHQFYDQVLGDESVEKTCQRTVETAAELMDSERVSLLVTEQDGRCLRFGHAVGIAGYRWREQSVPLSSPVAGRVIATERELVVNAHAPGLSTPGRYRSSSFISIPMGCGSIPTRRRVIGVLNVTEHRGGLGYSAEQVQMLRQLARTSAFALDANRTRRQLNETRDSIIFSMAKLSEYRHPASSRHLEHVRELSVLLARYLANDPRIPEKIDGQFVADIGRAAPLHDLGKVAIPDRILLKQTQLSPAEFRLIQEHTRIGAEALRSIIAVGHDASFLQMAIDIALHHHERYDGKGYPDGLLGEAIPLSARIVCLADCYDAIRMPREYKRTRSHAEASRELLLGSGTQFDSRVVQAFCALEHEFGQICQEPSSPEDQGLTAQTRWDKMMA